MEIPADARLVEGVWRYRPKLAEQKAVHLLDAGRGADWDICVAGECHKLASLMENSDGGLTLSPCAPGTKLTPLPGPDANLGNGD
jgi:hypothetical protein